jgi:hypothetical protein
VRNEDESHNEARRAALHAKQASNVKAAKEKNEFVEQDDQLMLQAGRADS